MACQQCGAYNIVCQHVTALDSTWKTGRITHSSCFATVQHHTITAQCQCGSSDTVCIEQQLEQALIAGQEHLQYVKTHIAYINGSLPLQNWPQIMYIKLQLL